MADILRYDFQIQEALNAHPDSSHEVDSELRDLKLPGYSKQMQNIVKLARYIKERYFSPQSQNFCNFQKRPEVLQNILEKYDNLHENLDDFLFEFQRPCVEEMLQPKYQLFIDSREFSEMMSDMQTQDAFEWILTQRAG